MEELKGLHNLRPGKGRVKDKKRLGRGTGSRFGKTAGKGHKGQRARKGGGIRAGFEGGQMPLYRRLPKRGFTNIFNVKYNAINLDALNRFDQGTKITPELLKEAGLLRMPSAPVKLLARGKLEKSLTIQVHKASQAAKDAVSKSGGSLEEI
jgi:large subunit ribosomal protein L15